VPGFFFCRSHSVRKVDSSESESRLHSFLEQRVEGFDEDRGCLAEFRFARSDQLPQNAFALRRNTHEDKAAMPLAPFALNEPAFLHAIHQFDRAVMTQAEPFGHGADRRFHSFRQPFQEQQQAIMARLKSGGPGRLIAQREITAKFVPELRERSIVRKCDIYSVGAFCHGESIGSIAMRYLFPCIGYALELAYSPGSFKVIEPIDIDTHFSRPAAG